MPRHGSREKRERGKESRFADIIEPPGDRDLLLVEQHGE